MTLKDIESILSEYQFVYNNQCKLPASYFGTKLESCSDQLNIINQGKLVIYDGSVNNLGIEENVNKVYDNIHSAYDGTIIENDDNINYILSLTNKSDVLLSIADDLSLKIKIEPSIGQCSVALTENELSALNSAKTSGNISVFSDTEGSVSTSPSTALDWCSNVFYIKVNNSSGVSSTLISAYNKFLNLYSFDYNTDYWTNNDSLEGQLNNINNFKLTYVTGNSTEFKNIGDDLAQFDNITDLKILGQFTLDDFDNIPDSIRPNLKSLTLDGVINETDPDIGDYTGLTNLVIINNSIDSINSNIDDLDNIQTFDFSHNGYTGGGRSHFADMNSLTTIDLSYNQLDRDDVTDFMLPNLVNLNLSNNIIDGSISHEFEDIINNGGHMVNLNLSNNNIDKFHLSEGTTYNTKLEILDLSNNDSLGVLSNRFTKDSAPASLVNGTSDDKCLTIEGNGTTIDIIVGSDSGVCP